MSPETPEPQLVASGDTISRNAIFAFATQMSTAIFTAALTVFLTRALGPAEFGILSLALSATGLIRRASAGATSQAVARFVAERRGVAGAILGVVGMALRIRLLTTLSLSATLFALAGPIADLYNQPALTWPLRGVAIAFSGQSILGFGTSVFMAMRQTSRAFHLVVSESAMEFTASVALVLLGAGATGAAFGRAIGYTFGAGLAVFLIGRLLGHSPIFNTGKSPVGRREFAGYASAMLIVTTASAVFSQLDVLLLGAFVSASAVGIYTAPLRLITVLGYPGLAVAQAVGPRLARHPADPPNVAALERALGYVVIVQAAMITLLVVWAEPIVRLALGGQFIESSEVLRALTPFMFLVGVAPMLISPLNYAGEGRRRIPISIATLMLAVILDVVLIQEIGILGAAVGTDIAYALFAGAHLRLAHRALGLPLRPLALTTLRAVGASAGLAGVLAIMGTGELSVVDWIAGLLAGSAVFVGILLVTKETSPEELRYVSRLPMRALGKG